MVLLGIGLAGCGGGLVPSFEGTTKKPAPVVTDASVTPMKASDIAGTYTIDSVTFEADIAKDVQPIVVLDHKLKTVTSSVNGNPQDIQARLNEAYLVIGDSGVFSFYYSIVDEKGQAVKVGAFQSGSLSGILEMGVNTVGFVAGESNGLADDQETAYTVKHDATSLTLTDIVKDSPTAHFSIISATKD